MQKNKLSVWILIPARNCAHAIDEIIVRLNALNLDLSILVVDDESSDDTLDRAKCYPNVLAVRNQKNLGYGGTSTKLYQLALQKGADLVINVHGDLGHRPEDIVPILDALKREGAGIAVGSRLVFMKNQLAEYGLKVILNSDLRGGMPLLRLGGHFFLTGFQNLLFGQKLHSYHEGMRGCTRDVISWILEQDMPDWYDYDATLLVLAAANGKNISEVPTPPHYSEKAKSSAPPIRYGLTVLKDSILGFLKFRKIKRSSEKQPDL